MINLQEIWNQLASKYSGDSQFVKKLWEEIEFSYTNKNRYYHNLGHLEYMIEKAQQYKEKLTDPDTVFFSIFYHDIVYDPKRQDNEQKSAEIARENLSRLGVPSEKIVNCQNQIISTKAHSRSIENDINYLLDFDLAILGESPELYTDYTKKIRKEYSIYPDFLYKRGRKKVLQHFIEMDRIFKTEEFYNNYERQARENMKTELIDP